MDQWSTLVARFGRLIGVDGLEIESAGACRLELDERLAIDFEVDLNNQLHLYSVMPSVPADVRPAVALRLLSENYAAHRRHDHSMFVHDEGAGVFLLHRRMPDTVETVEEFELIVRSFSEAAESWIDRIDGDLSRPPAVASTESVVPSSFISQRA